VFDAQQRAAISAIALPLIFSRASMRATGFNNVAAQLVDLLEVFEKIPLPQISSDSKMRQLDAPRVDS
jgi:hypothetical protein